MSCFPTGDLICKTLLKILAYNMIEGIFLTMRWLKFLLYINLVSQNETN